MFSVLRRFGRGVAPAALAAALFVAPVAAQARVHWSIGIGVPFYGPGWYEWGPPPAFVWPAWSPPVIVQQPPVVVQPAPPLPPGPPPQSYWYYCQNPAGYYPYVATCPGGWRQVPAQPSSAPGS